MPLTDEHKGTPRAAVFVDTGVSPPSSFLLPTSPYPDLILLMSASDLQAGWRLRLSMHKETLASILALTAFFQPHVEPA